VSVYRKQGSQIYSYDFVAKGNRFSGSTGATTKREAEAVEAIRREEAIASIKAAGQAAVSLAIDHVADRWWQAVGQYHAGADTTARDLKRLVEYFGKNCSLADIHDPEVMKIVAWRRGHRSKSQPETLIAPATVNRSTTEVLKKLFNHAKREGARFEREPVWKNHMLKEPEELVRELQVHDAAAIDAEMRDDYAPLFELAQASGMRQREVALLEWSEVDFAAKRITKRGKGGRPVYVSITPTMHAILWPLQGHHPVQVFTYQAARTVKSKGLIKGERYPVTLSGLKVYWRRMRARAGVEGFRFHDLRHDFATKLLRKTGNLRLVQRALNHKNIKTTSKYAHVQDDEIAAAMEAVARDRRTESHDVSHQKHLKAV